MNIGEILSKLKGNPSSIQDWRLLGDALRDEDIRSNEIVTESISEIQDMASITFDPINEALILEVLRALVNLTADNDVNRSRLTENNTESKKFWEILLNLFEIRNETINTRLIILFNQFINNTELKKDYLEFFYQIKVDSALINYLEGTLGNSRIGDFDMSIEFLSEYFDININSVLHESRIIVKARKYIDLLLISLERVLTEVDENYLESSNEMLLNLSNILLNLTSFEDLLGIQSINPNLRCLSIIKSITMDFENKVTIKRKLLAVSGNITSMKSYNSKDELYTLINYFKHPHKDPYLMSSCAISIGNYVTSKEKLEELKYKIIEIMPFEEFINSFFSIEFNDIMQYQALHMLNNLLSSDNSALVLQQNGLISMSKLIIDNSSYYKEVLNIFLKFIKKLIRCELIQNKTNMDHLMDLWLYFENLDSSIEKEEVFLLVLQGYINNLNSGNTSFIKTLILNMISTNALSSEISFNFLAEKLKTMGMFNQKVLTLSQDVDDFGRSIFGDVEKYENEFLLPLFELLDIIHRTLSNKEVNSPDIIWNNSKFVAATLISVMEKSKTREANKIISIAKNIVLLNSQT